MSKFLIITQVLILTLHIWGSFLSEKLCYDAFFDYLVLNLKLFTTAQ